MMRRLLSARFLLPLGAVLFVLGAKLALVETMGSDVPLADQWTAEGSTLFQVKLHRGRIPLEHFFFSNSEHRPATTRFLAYALFVADNGQWDCRVQAVVNLLFQGATVLVLWFAAGAFLSGAPLGLARGLAVVLCSLPASHENFTWGFQSQFLLCILCGLVHILGTVKSARPDFRWAAAQAVGVVGILSLASGLLSAAALVGLAVVERIRGRRDNWWWATLLVNGAQLAWGFWFMAKVPEATGHAGSPAAFLRAFGVLLAWPVYGHAWGMLVQLPLLAGVIFAWRQPAGSGPAARFLGLSAWFLLLLAALAYGRGGEAMQIAVRYFDMLVVGCWLNGVAVLWLWQATANSPARWLPGILALSLLVMLGGLAYWNRPAGIRATVADMQNIRRLRDGAVRDFLATNDPGVFQRYDWMGSRFPHLPYTIELLRDPLMRPALPPSLQPDGRAGWLSRIALALAPRWSWLMLAGAGLLVLGGWRRRTAPGS
jgi:hypothetical protein